MWSLFFRGILIDLESNVPPATSVRTEPCVFIHLRSHSLVHIPFQIILDDCYLLIPSTHELIDINMLVQGDVL